MTFSVFDLATVFYFGRWWKKYLFTSQGQVQGYWLWFKHLRTLLLPMVNNETSFMFSTQWLTWSLDNAFCLLRLKSLCFTFWSVLKHCSSHHDWRVYSHEFCRFLEMSGTSIGQFLLMVWWIFLDLIIDARYAWC